jgi:hypothetical protein
MYHHLFGKRGQLAILVDCYRGLGQPRAFVLASAVLARLAQDRSPDDTVLAGVARAASATDDVIAGSNVTHFWPDGLNDTRNFVPENRWHRVSPLTVPEQEIAVAKTGRHRPHENFTPDGGRDLNVLDDKGLPSAVQNRCFQRITSSATSERKESHYPLHPLLCG